MTFFDYNNIFLVTRDKELFLGFSVRSELYVVT